MEQCLCIRNFITIGQFLLGLLLFFFHFVVVLESNFMNIWKRVAERLLWKNSWPLSRMIFTLWAVTIFYSNSRKIETYVLTKLQDKQSTQTSKGKEILYYPLIICSMKKANSLKDKPFYLSKMCCIKHSWTNCLTYEKVCKPLKPTNHYSVRYMCKK